MYFLSEDMTERVRESTAATWHRPFTERPKLLTDSLIRALINWLCVCVFLFSGISSSASSLHSVALGDH